jgi:hypothetical protein
MRGARIVYSAAEMAWLEANRTMIISDYHRAFQAQFDRPDISAANLHALRKRKGWKVGRAKGRFVGRNRTYSAAELTWLHENCALSLKECHAAYCAAFQRDDVTAAKLHSLRKRMKLKTGRTGQFKKGAAPWSKGKKLPFNAASAATQFKKNQVAHNYRGPGHESIDEDGYVWIVTDRPNPYTGASTWRVHKHRYLWEQENGPVPEGHVLKCLDSNKLNTDPSNWEPVPLAVLGRLNGGRNRKRVAYDAAAPELKPTVLTLAKLEHQAREPRGGRHHIRSRRPR